MGITTKIAKTKMTKTMTKTIKITTKMAKTKTMIKMAKTKTTIKMAKTKIMIKMTKTKTMTKMMIAAPAPAPVLVSTSGVFSVKNNSSTFQTIIQDIFDDKRETENVNTAHINYFCNTVFPVVFSFNKYQTNKK